MTPEKSTPVENHESLDRLIHGLRLSVSWAQETKGVGFLALPLISRIAGLAEQLGYYADSAQFWNHQIMIADQYRRGLIRRLPAFPGSVGIENFCQQKMEDGLNHAERLIQSHPDAPGMATVANRQSRFAGELLLSRGRYGEAIDVLQQGIDRLESSSEPENALELRGMQAEAYVRNGDLVTGVRQGLDTYDDYANTAIGRHLRDDIDKERWLKWRAGAVLKLTQALLDTDAFTRVPEGERWLILHDLRSIYQDGVKEPGIDFQIRKEQLEVIWETLLAKGYTSGSLLS